MDDSIDTRPVNVIRLALAIANERLAAFDPDNVDVGGRDYWIACNRVQCLEDELYLAESAAERMAERVAQKWLHRYGPRQRQRESALIQDSIHVWD